MTWGGRRAQRLVVLVLGTYGIGCHLCLGLLERGPATTADHVVPRVAGGDDSLENLRPAHLSCNSRRGGRSIEWFRRTYCPELLADAGAGLEFFQTASADTPRTPRPFSPDRNNFSAGTDPEPTPDLGFFLATKGALA